MFFERCLWSNVHNFHTARCTFNSWTYHCQYEIRSSGDRTIFSDENANFVESQSEMRAKRPTNIVHSKLFFLDKYILSRVNVPKRDFRRREGPAYHFIKKHKTSEYFFLHSLQRRIYRMFGNSTDKLSEIVESTIRIIFCK